jgi:hypothetical protein
LLAAALARRVTVLLGVGFRDLVRVQSALGHAILHFASLNGCGADKFPPTRGVDGAHGGIAAMCRDRGRVFEAGQRAALSPRFHAFGTARGAERQAVGRGRG